MAAALHPATGRAVLRPLRIHAEGAMKNDVSLVENGSTRTTSIGSRLPRAADPNADGGFAVSVRRADRVKDPIDLARALVRAHAGQVVEDDARKALLQR